MHFVFDLIIIAVIAGWYYFSKRSNQISCAKLTWALKKSGYYVPLGSPRVYKKKEDDVMAGLHLADIERSVRMFSEDRVSAIYVYDKSIDKYFWNLLGLDYFGLCVDRTEERAKQRDSEPQEE